MEIINLISDSDGQRIDSWLAENLEEYSRTYIKKLIEENLVKVNGKNVKSNYKIKQKDKIEVQIPEAELLKVVPENIPLEIVYDDEYLLIVNKPKGMVVHPAAGNYSGTLVNALMYHYGESLSTFNGIIRPGIVHRIDKDTSGLLVVAKDNATHEKLSNMLKIHDITRVYHAVVHGIIKADNGKIDAPIGRHPVDRKKMSVNIKNGRSAVTHFKVLERFKNETYIELKLETGRTHQIRVHMSYIGYPILGDEIYGRKKDNYGFSGQALHAKVLGFVHPVTGEYVEFNSELPDYFKNLLRNLR